MLLMHAIFAITGIIVICTGIFMAAFMRNHRWWLYAHKRSGLIGFICLGATVVSAFVMVAGWQGTHFINLHGLLGIAVMLLAACALLLGYLQFKLTNHRASVRLLHRIAGFSVSVLMIINGLMGLRMTGIIF